MLLNGIDKVFALVLGHLLRHGGRLLSMSICILTPVLLSGCADTLSTLHPAGPAADTIAMLWWIMLAGASLIFLMVMALLVLAFRRRTAPVADFPEASGERVWIQFLGLAFPLSVLAALLAFGLVLGEKLAPKPVPGVTSVGAEARQWAWTFTYADAPGRATQGILHIPAGRPVDVAITTRDVIHSFWVPRLAGKLDAIPGHVNILRIEAWQPGTYEGVSSEFSGSGYRKHTFRVVAHDPAHWDAFMKGAAE